MTDSSATAVANRHYLETLDALEDAYRRGATALEIAALEDELATAEAESRVAA